MTSLRKLALLVGFLAPANSQFLKAPEGALLELPAECLSTRDFEKGKMLPFNVENALGRGFDILKGNLLSTAIDTSGMKSGVFKICADKDIGYEPDFNNELNFYQMRGVNYDRLVQTDVASATAQTLTMREYQSAVSTMVGTEVGGWGAKFSASTDFGNTKKDLSQTNKKTFQLDASQVVYQAVIPKSNLHDPDMAPPFDPAFLYDVKENLPSELNKNTSAAFAKFVDTYGYMVITKVNMGAKYCEKRIYSERDIRSAQTKHLDVASTVGGGFASFSASASSKVSMTDAQKQWNKNSQAETTAYYIGVKGKPANDTEFLHEAQNNAQPIQISLTGWDDIFYLISHRLPNATLWRAKFAALDEYIRSYCASKYSDEQCNDARIDLYPNQVVPPEDQFALTQLIDTCQRIKPDGSGWRDSCGCDGCHHSRVGRVANGYINCPSVLGARDHELLNARGANKRLKHIRSIRWKANIGCHNCKYSCLGHRLREMLKQ